MYITKIDDFIDKIIDDFGSEFIKNKKIEQIVKELNFVKFQSDINDILKKYISSLNMNELLDNVTNKDILNKFTEVVKKYITIYVFLFIGFSYKGTSTMYANNIIEFSKNQPEFGFKIENFFNSESNAFVVELYGFIKKLLNLLDAESKQRKEILSNKPDYKDVNAFINDMGDEIVNAFFYNDNSSIRAHNIIKLIIFDKIYKGIEKAEIFRILDLLENTETDFTFIDIVVPVKELIDISTIESLLSKKEIQSGFAKMIWEYIYESEFNEFKIEKNSDEKINDLINSNILVPIVDDMLLFHNQNENYEKNVEDQKKKREDTKIRYIIDKIDMAVNLNIPEKHAEAKKIYPSPTYNRKIVYINNFEDIRIINKFINFSKLSSENSEYLKDLENIVIYPYINLRDSQNGIVIPLNKTINALRYINFESSSEIKQRPNAYIENRVGCKDSFINVVGFLINPSHSTYCIKNKNLKQITDNKEKNGFNATLNMIENNLKTDENNLNLYWLFDPDNDKVELNTYEQQNKFTRQDQLKQILVAMYDSLEKLTFETIISEIKKLKNPYMNVIEHVINKYYKKLFKIEKNDLLVDLENDIYDKFIKKDTIKYDKLDDIVNGLAKDSIELPNMKKQVNKKLNKIVIDLSKLTETGTYEEKEKIDGICQHNITWDRLGVLKKENPKLFLDELYIFVQQYVIENVDHDYVCKSCGFFLNIKKYVADGAFDDDHHFITYSMPLDTPLEDILEYEKFKGAIRNIDKYIEKIALIVGVPYFTGTNPTVKSRRKLVTRDAIDIILANNIKLKKILKERNEVANKLYGINRSFSNLFIFELENSIFIFSSKDTDFYKPIKQNNILGYIIYLFMLELNESHILYFNNDKKGYCNFEIFDKIFNTLFEGLKFRKNNKGDTVSVKNYPVFCYMLYMISCYCVKYNLWYYDYKDSENDKSKRIKLLPVVQKIIIHTVIDIINSCIENSEDDKKNKIFEILKTKFYKKLNSMFANKELYDRLKEQNMPSTIGDKKQFILTKTESFNLDGIYLTNFNSVKTWRKIKQPLNTIDIKSRKPHKYSDITNITNCDSGTFHNWTFDKDSFKCKICNIISKDTTYDEKSTEKIKNKFHIVELKSLSKKYCYIDGLFHEFIVNKTGQKICSKCKSEENAEYAESELEKLDKNLIKNREILINKNMDIIKEIDEENKKYIDYINKLKNRVNDEFTQYPNEKYFDVLTEYFEQNISDELIKSNISINHNVYLFDHDHLGAKVEKIIAISEKENKIQFKSAHPFFNTDVIYYTTYKSGKIDVFYSSITKILLGYKEENKNFVMNINTDKKIKIVYSIKNKLKMLGHKYQFYTIDNNDNNEIVLDIIRERHSLLKNTIYRFQRVLFRTKNNYINKKKTKENEFVNEEEDYFSNKFEGLSEKYSKKMIKLDTVSQKGTHLIFKHWKNYSDNIFINTKNEDIEIKNNMINYEKINKLDQNGNLLLFYFINELIKLYKYNDDKSIRINLTALIIDYININFSIYNEDKTQNNKDYKRFIYVINSALYLDEIKDKIGETEGIYEEAVDPDKKEISTEEQEALDDAKEEDDALDVEGGEYDYEAGYERNLERPLDPDFVKNFEYNYLDYYALVND